MEWKLLVCRLDHATTLPSFGIFYFCQQLVVLTPFPHLFLFSRIFSGLWDVWIPYQFTYSAVLVLLHDVWNKNLTIILVKCHSVLLRVHYSSFS